MLEDPLTDSHVALQDDGQRAGIPDLELDGVAEECRIKVGVAEPSVNRGCRDVNTKSKTGQAALSLDPSGQA